LKKDQGRDYTMRLVLVGLMAALCSAQSMPQSPKIMGDPLFAITYDPSKVHFETMPRLLAERCPKLHGRYVAAWVYGHLKTENSEYFVVSGLMESQEDRPGGARSIAPEDGDGLVVALQGSKCLVDQADYFFSQEINPAKTATPIIAPPSVLTGILHDAFRRCIEAFGGRKECLERARPDAIEPPFVRKEVEKLRKDLGV
jgi:hypothetical protein